MVRYRQCLLHRDLARDKYEEQMTYIPEPYCVVGKVLMLRDAKGNWDNGWVVYWTAIEAVEEQQLPDPDRQLLNLRQMERTGRIIPASHWDEEECW